MIHGKQYALIINLIIVIFFVILTIVINSQMIRFGLNGLGDVRWHIGWVQNFSAQLQEGILYPRWLANTNFGYGSPTFVFYPPLVYYFGSILRIVGFNSQQTMTLLFSLPILLSGISFYVYGQSKWNSISATAGALSYMLCPFIIHSVNFGNLSTLWTIPLLPLGMFFTDKCLENSKWGLLLTVFVSLIALTHTPTLLIYTIAWLLYMIYQTQEKPVIQVIITIIFAFAGLGLASFYLLPAILEQKYVNIDYQSGSMGGFSTLPWKDLFMVDGPYSIGAKNVIATISIAIISIIYTEKRKPYLKHIMGWIIFMVIVLFMVSNLSEIIWYSSHILLKVQRSGRIMGLFYFAQAVLFSWLIKSLLGLKIKQQLIPITILTTILFVNFQYGYNLTRQSPGLNAQTQGVVSSREWMEIALFEPLSEKLLDVPEFRPQIISPYEFNPDVRESTPVIDGIPTPNIIGGNPYFPVPKLNKPKMEVLQGEGDIFIENWSSYVRNFRINVNQQSRIKIRTYYYPAWTLKINDQMHDIDILEDGTIGFSLDQGIYQGTLNYNMTPAFAWGILLSILSIIFLLVLYIIFNNYDSVMFFWKTIF
ncbi:hypothetical protein Cyast_0070 [Cyanobacterium stanieri PCC 7202]|uniref:Membrane protein 6-pyruvoyl-tetrahydropterin synthase-related domain-containing protein n=1 Tax=Cyanobacterium stanieri (strain ATCC 29140 / PCC 7202) TaxID=292563 RepID=K9YGR5_CYASC|nr:hypothetical protein Cyast_0070 [Cyanobacterium stanieri PCC 7202]